MKPDTLNARDDSDSEVDSLFDSYSPIRTQFESISIGGSTSTESCPKSYQGTTDTNEIYPAQRIPPPIPGLFFLATLTIPPSLEDTLLESTSKYFSPGTSTSPRINQAMLFGRHTPEGSGLPPFLDELIPILSSLLKPHLPNQINSLLFPRDDTTGPCTSRQAILNYYDPGEGITPHVDLLRRFGDGIFGISLGSGTVMVFQHAEKKKRYDLYLPRGSIIILTGEARYEWTHGIEGREVDYVEDRKPFNQGGPTTYSWIVRTTRTSITVRWLLPGADVVGGD